MIFTTWTFLFFFVGVMVLLGLARNRTQRQLVLLISSLAFYAYWNKYYLLLLATPSVIDFYCAKMIGQSEQARTRRFWLVVSLSSNLGLLAYFKYANFFLSNLAELFGRDFPKLDILLPVGISFYTFKTLSYTIDVYRREIPVCNDWWRYAMFVTFFPDLIAGPIVRASVFLPQMKRSLRPSWPRAAMGLQLVLLGVAKKLLVADRLAVLPDAVFLHPELFSPATVACAVVAYSLQIYCDFSGYSDIAIGISRVIGFDLPENFNMPYSATSITDFWHRWHMTLSRWLRDYLYIPLGGNRRGRFRTYLNLMITMLLGGLWHGANWTFVVWGALQGIALALHKYWTEKTKGRAILPESVSWLFTQAFVCLGWVFFRSADFHTAFIILRKLTFVDDSGISYFYLPLALILPLVIGAHWIGRNVEQIARSFHFPRSIPAPQMFRKAYAEASSSLARRPHPAAGYYVQLPLPSFLGGLCLTLGLLVLFLFAASDSTPFIYFRF